VTIRTNLTIGLLCGFFAVQPPLPGTTPAIAQQPGEEISVELSSGRTFRARLDARTDARQLWLRWQQESAVVLRPIRWDRVVRARVAEQELSGESLREVVSRWQQQQPAGAPHAATEKRLPDQRPLPSAGWASAESIAAWQQRPQAPPVHCLAVDAVVANWDADVEADGLLLYVCPLDAHGQLVPARGTLSVELTGLRIGVVKRAQPFGRLGHWTRQVRREDFGPRGAVLRLPFQSVHPDFDLEYGSHGAVHARLSVPGQGTFETTASTVRIRRYSAIRDQLQQVTGRRFFPHEHTAAGR